MIIPLKKYKVILFSIILFLLGGCSSSKQIFETPKNTGVTENYHPNLDLDTVKVGRFDTGKMWTFDYPPIKYFKEAYNFSPSQQWFDDVRMAALRFGSICSASFVSADGLIMTNDHCARESIDDVTIKGEDLDSTGFFAKTLAEERRVPGLFVDQLVLIKDITGEIEKATAKGKTEDEKESIKQQTIIEIDNQQKEATGLKISIVSFYNGAKYSLYGYKTYDDVRLVFTPELQLGFFGGDYDNFTYPRYNLDCSFFRVYDKNGKPLKTNNYFKWSKNGAEPGEPVFVVGNPGTTKRLLTVAQLEYLRDVTYPNNIDFISGIIDTYQQLIKQNPENSNRLKTQLLTYTNSQKAYEGMLAGLRDPILMQKKKDFEENLKKKVHSNSELIKKYGNLWDKIEKNRNETKNIINEISALSLNIVNSSDYFNIAHDLVELARQLKQPENERLEIYKGDDLDSTIENIFPEDFDYELNKEMLVRQLDFMRRKLNSELINKITDGKNGEAAADYMINNSSLTSKEKIKKLIDEGPDAILNSNDPFIYFVVHSENREDELRARKSQLDSDDDNYSQELGKLIYEVYGTSIPPDATFTLRISDGVIKGYPYNGTIAPPITTFYGMYDRYFSFDKKFPWNLPRKWKTPPNDFDLSTPFNFVATNDITGGNSGSPVINENKEIVGLAFDGNIESFPGVFIYSPEKNRMVAVHSVGILESLIKVYKAKRLSDELINGKLSEKK